MTNLVARLIHIKTKIPTMKIVRTTPRNKENRPCLLIVRAALALFDPISALRSFQRAHLPPFPVTHLE